jgi:hypothetical protein
MEKNSTLFSAGTATSNEKELPLKEQELNRVIPEELPSQSAIANILNFSKALEVLPTKSIEERPGIELVLN